jgi:hypothetical protein
MLRPSLCSPSSFQLHRLCGRLGRLLLPLLLLLLSPAPASASTLGDQQLTPGASELESAFPDPFGAQQAMQSLGYPPSALQPLSGVLLSSGADLLQLATAAFQAERPEFQATFNTQPSTEGVKQLFINGRQEHKWNTGERGRGGGRGSAGGGQAKQARPSAGCSSS